MTATTTDEGQVTGIVQARRLVTEVPGPRSRELLERTRRAVSGGVGMAMPAFIDRAEGAICVDVDGNQLIDLGSGIAVTTVGHAVPEVVGRARSQLGRFTHTSFMVNPYEAYTEVCEELNELAPVQGPAKSVLLNSGSEAVENAVKIARLHTGRQAVVTFDHAYHGRTNLTMAMTAKTMPYKQGFGPFAGEIHRMPMPYAYRWPGPSESIVEDSLRMLTQQVHTQVGEENVACLVIEPIQGEGGFIVPPEGWLSQVAQWCREHGILLVADEIQTGWCRTGEWFACDHEGVKADLVTTAKGIAGGLPLSAVTGRAEVMDSVHPGGLGGTYGGNPVSCAAALGAIEVMRSEDLAARARQVEEIFRTRLGELAERHPEIGEIRGRGAMMAMELVRPGTTEPDADLARAVNARCHEQGVITLTAGTFGNVMRFLPSLAISDELLAEALDVVASSLDEACR